MAQTVNPVPSTWAFKKREIDEVQGGSTVTDTYIVPTAQTTAFEAAYPRNFAHPVFTASVCTRYRITPVDGEGDQIYEYVLTYEPLSLSYSNGRPPKLADNPSSSDPLSVIWEWVGVQDDTPITSHPSYSTSWDTTKPGVQSYIRGGAVFRKTVALKLDYVFNADELAQHVGKRQAPENLAGTLADKKYWIRLPNNCRSAGGYLEFVAEWKFAPDEVDTDIYTDA